MLSGARAWVLLGACVLLLGALGPGCKDRDSGGQDSRPLPTPEPPATASTELPKDAAPTPKKRAVDDDSVVKPKRAPADEVPEKAAGVGGTGAAPAPVDAAASAAPEASTPPLPAPPCLARCHGAMQGCLSAPVDGGVPGFSNLELCKKAFEACQSACAKP
jgi:hypothetical protein